MATTALTVITPMLTSILFLLSKKQDWLGNIRGDILAGLVVALALIPEAIAFSIIAGVDHIVIGRPIVKAANPRQAAENIIKEIEDGYREIA